MYFKDSGASIIFGTHMFAILSTMYYLLFAIDLLRLSL
jgi:hypothetical protein